MVQIQQVFNIADERSFTCQLLIDYVDSLGEVTLQFTLLTPHEKIIHLADHHGIRELTEFAEKLKYSPYIESIRSTSWGGSKFIRRKDRTGAVELVLIKTQRRYALWVQTTGRNLRETEAIASILEDEFY